MKSLLRESMEDGAFGMSTGLDYPPGAFADTGELVALCTEVARLGGFYHTHVRYGLGDRYLDPFREAVEIGRRSGVPVHITHLFRRVTQPRGARPILDFVEEARDGGLDITFDCFPYRYGGTKVLIVFPQWAHEGGPHKLMEVLRSEEGRERLRKEVKPRGLGWEEMWLTYFKKPHNKRYEGRTIAEFAEMEGKPTVDALCDLLLDEDLRVSYFADIADPATLNGFIVHPLYMVGSDALLLGDLPPPMAYGTYPFILSEIVREERPATLAARGDQKDDLVSRAATRTSGPRAARRRNEGGHRRLRSQDHQGPRHPAGHQAALDWRRLRHRQRNGGHGPRPAHRGAAWARPADGVRGSGATRKTSVQDTGSPGFRWAARAFMKPWAPSRGPARSSPPGPSRNPGAPS